MSDSKVKGPKHGQSLVEDELESRSNLAKAREPRGQKKDVQDPTLGATLTNKILRSAIAQIEEGREGAQTVIQLPEFSGSEDSVEDIDIEVADEDAQDLFQMFSAESSRVSHVMTHELAKTRHQVDETIRQVYTELGQLLKYYKTGKLPKAVNVLASQNIPDWIDLLYLSKPLSWSPQALAAVTLQFVQAGSDNRCEVFYSEILLDYIFDRLDTKGKLPKDMWKALRHAARRPKIFIKQILKPIAMDPSCSVKEAKAISSMITQVRLPPIHVSAFLTMICTEGDIYHKKTIMVAKFIERGQALAIQAIDGVVAYFLCFRNEPPQPVLWHKALLDFVKRYGTNLTQEQREALLDLLNFQTHHAITKEIGQRLIEMPFDASVNKDDAAPLPVYPAE